jgi:hypothetical protein
VSLIAGATFANTDLYKFIEVDGSGHAVIGASTSAVNVVGTLLSVTGTTAGAGVETVTVGLLSGIGKVRMAGSTRAAGQAVSASSAGLGIAPTTDAFQLGISIAGSSGTTGRVHSVLFAPGLKN